MSRSSFDLNEIIVASPCTASWASMGGDERVRSCPTCRHNVYNLSAMSRAEAEALVREKEEGRLCVRFYRRGDGTMLTRDCPIGANAWRWRVMMGFVFGGVVLVTAAFAGLGWLASKNEPGANPFEQVLHKIFPGMAPPTMVMGTPCPPPMLVAPIPVAPLPKVENVDN